MVINASGVLRSKNMCYTRFSVSWNPHDSSVWWCDCYLHLTGKSLVFER